MESLITNLDLFVILKRENTSFKHELLYETVAARLGENLALEERVTLMEFCRQFTRAAAQRWKKSHRNSDCFRRNYEDWLQNEVDWPACVQLKYLHQDASTPPPEEQILCSKPSTSSAGTMTKRTRKPFEDLGCKQKKRRSDDHQDEDPNELAHTAAALFKKNGRNDIADVIQYMLKNPEEAVKIKEIINKPAHTTILYTAEKALGLLLSMKLTKWSYITLRESAIREGAKDMYPSYYKVQQAKLRCYPPKESITVTDSSASITLQALLDITIKRIFESLPSNVKNKQLMLICKWGFDGASNQSRYKQRMEGDHDDSSIFMTSLVPLKLTEGDNVVWENQKPCSSLFCRPVEFTFVKESEAVVISHKEKMENAIKALTPTECNTNKVSHKLMLTMIDGKICTYISEARSNASCYLCLAKPTEMNRLSSVRSKDVSTGLYELGLSSLHARINSMECLLHIAYNQDFKKWAARENEHKVMRETRKKLIQDRFKDELNLLIDIVKQGSGTTNDGNTARRFFECPEKTAAITGLDKELVQKFAVLLQVITSGERIDVTKFRIYADETAERYVQLYDWYYMSSTVHKLLIHGADIIASNAIVPIGSLSEEASEARNKDFRRFREHNSRKKSRIASNEDIFNMLLLSSDPLLSSSRPKFIAKGKSALFPEAKELLSSSDSSVVFVDVSNLSSDSELEDSDEEF